MRIDSTMRITTTIIGTSAIIANKAESGSESSSPPSCSSGSSSPPSCSSGFVVMVGLGGAV